MSSMPTGNATPTGPPDNRFTEAMSRADGCPECVVNYQTPYRVVLMDAGFTSYYRCASCEHFWSTTWGDR